MNMQPVVNGLEQAYNDQIEFRKLDVNSPEGQQVFRTYALPGHPGYILLNPEGDVLWMGFGEQSREGIEAQLQLAIDR